MAWEQQQKKTVPLFQEQYLSKILVQSQPGQEEALQEHNQLTIYQ